MSNHRSNHLSLQGDNTGFGYEFLSKRHIGFLSDNLGFANILAFGLGLLRLGLLRLGLLSLGFLRLGLLSLGFLRLGLLRLGLLSLGFANILAFGLGLGHSLDHSLGQGLGFADGAIVGECDDFRDEIVLEVADDLNFLLLASAFGGGFGWLIRVSFFGSFFGGDIFLGFVEFDDIFHVFGGIFGVVDEILKEFGL